MPGPVTIPSEKPANSDTSPDTTATQPASNATNSTPHTKSEAEEAADRLYEERIEEEYAKREGGA